MNKNGNICDRADHLSCPFYTDNNPHPLVEEIELGEKHAYHHETKEFEIVLILSGKVNLVRDGSSDQIVHRRRLFMLPPGITVSFHALSPSYIIICKLNQAVKGCGMITAQMPSGSMRTESADLYALPFNHPVTRFAENFAACISHGLRCETYLIAKYTELMFMLRNYYNGSELVEFFRPAMGKDMAFRTCVMNAVPEIKNVKEMANKCHMSEATFRRKFVKEFGIPPKEYLTNRNKTRIINELRNGTKTNKQLCEEYGFPDPSSFTKFCIKHFGAKPSEIRMKGRG